ncbi:MAG: hypothetical protein MUF53_08970 [Gemmatimonadaceae bacterium]|jgi:hypothetical protein|nr:hypothetical protein [Gemmatimonadaceae bacterium]
MRTALRVVPAMLAACAGCATFPRLPEADAGCFAVSTDVPVPPFLGRPAPVLPPFVQLDAREMGRVLAPSRWALGSGPGQRYASLSLFRPSVGVDGPSVTAPRALGVLPPDSLVLEVVDAPGKATVLLARSADGWAGRVVVPGPPVVMRMRRMPCPPEPMTFGVLRRP